MAAVLRAPTLVPHSRQVVWTLQKDGSTAIAIIREIAGMGREFRITVDGWTYWCAIYRYGSHLELMADQHRADFENRGWSDLSSG
jgi:hypothetical protein